MHAPARRATSFESDSAYTVTCNESAPSKATNPDSVLVTDRIHGIPFTMFTMFTDPNACSASSKPSTKANVNIDR
jgi:hypothetical protein